MIPASTGRELESESEKVIKLIKAVIMSSYHLVMGAKSCSFGRLSH